jgi:hypothetical protein
MIDKSRGSSKLTKRELHTPTSYCAEVSKRSCKGLLVGADEVGIRVLECRDAAMSVSTLGNDGHVE